MLASGCRTASQVPMLGPLLPRAPCTLPAKAKACLPSPSLGFLNLKKKEMFNNYFFCARSLKSKQKDLYIFLSFSHIYFPSLSTVYLNAHILASCVGLQAIPFNLNVNTSVNFKIKIFPWKRTAFSWFWLRVLFTFPPLCLIINLPPPTPFHLLNRIQKEFSMHLPHFKKLDS